MNISNKRAKIIKEIMKYKKHEDGIVLKDLYELIKSHPQYEGVFGIANRKSPKQYQNSTRRLLQERAPLSTRFKNKSSDFLNLGRKSGRWTYYSNPKFSNLIKTSKELSEKIKGIKNLELNKEEKTVLIKVRLNQTSFRKNLILEMKDSLGFSPIKKINKEELLIASHIVDHAHCDSIEEQANYFNGLILTPDVDKLFDRKLISFDEKGNIIIGDIDLPTLKKMGINHDAKLPKVLLTESRKEFLNKRNELYKFKR